MQPYYDAHLAPHVQKVQPYVDQAKNQVYTPAVTFAQENYAKHGAPRVLQARALGQKQWEQTLRPQVDVLKQQAVKQYDATLAPHVQKVDGIVRPYYDTVKTSATDFYELEVRPAYIYAVPRAHRAYGQLNRFTRNVALPYAQWSGNLAWTFVSRHIWPTVQILYGENVEPQITRIKQRLGRYKDEKKIEAAVESIEASSSASSASASLTSVSSSIAATVSEIKSSALSTTTSSASIHATPSAEPKLSASEQFANDLQLWEEQVAKAVEDGSDHLKERVQDICDKQIFSQANGVGKALIVQLEESASSAFKVIKSKIQSAVDDIEDDMTPEELSKTKDRLTNRVRLAGQTIKTKAQKVRDWKKSYDHETNTLVEAAANSTLETIDNIRDLRLQDIGRRWSSHSGITHKDWAKYSELKKASSQWRDQVADIATKHNKLIEARETAAAIEEKAMSFVEESAKELSRLKDVAHWKIDARDASDDFNTKYVPAAAAYAGQQVLDKVGEASQAVAGSSQGTIESMKSAVSSKAASIASSASGAASSASESAARLNTDSAESVASQLSTKIVPTSTGSVESAASRVSETAQSVASDASASLIGTEQPVVESVTSVVQKSAESAASRASGSAQSVVSGASASLVGTEQPTIESVTSVVQKSVVSAATALSETVLGTSQPAVESATSVVKESANSVASAASEAAIGTEAGYGEKAASTVSKAVVGSETPVAESVSSAVKAGIPDRPIKDSNRASSFLSAAKERAEKASSSVVGSSTNQAESVASGASSSAVSAASGVSSVASSVASSIVSGTPAASEATQKASKKVFGGAMAQAVPERQVVLDDIVDDEDDNSYSASMMSMVNNAMGEAKSLTQAVQDAMQSKPTQGNARSVSSVASEQYAQAMAAASSVLYGTKPGPGGAMATFASDRYSEAVTA